MFVCSSMKDTLPALAAIVIIPDEYKTVARTLDALVKQTAAPKVEIVFVVPAHADVSIPYAALEIFHSVQIVLVENTRYSSAMAAGIRQARAPIVALTEDHAFPATNWAERLIAAHSNGYAVVGPAMRLGNPRSPISLADFYIGYGKWADPIASGKHDFLMAHNVSYKRSVLLEYGARLEEMLDSETVMHLALAQQGYQLWLEATTYTTHLNFERWDTWIQAVLLNGRIFAAERAMGWHPAQRALFAFGAPLIPFVRFVRVRRDLRRAKLPFPLWLRVYAAVWLGLLVDAVGQGLGYALGRGQLQGQPMDFEYHRERHFTTSGTLSAE
jgi:hypothetical protein